MGKHLVAVAGLLGCNILMFYRHYLGITSFPWDFWGGYHFQTVGWLENGHFFSPPDWFPWGSMGYPAFLAIQSGAWYPPLVALDYLDIKYTFAAATWVQAFHVFFAALGVYVLFRALRLGWLYCFTAALIASFFSGFYSNQEHVDIIRAYTWIPWILAFLQKDLILRMRLAPVWLSLIVFSFLVSAYPGMIVPVFIASGVWFLYNVYALKESGQKQQIKSYFYYTALSCAAGVLLSMVKWFPAFLNLGQFDREFPRLGALSWNHLLTFIFPYDYPNAVLLNDITMRSLYVSPVALFTIFFIRKIRPLTVVGIVFVFFGMVFSTAFFGSEQIYMALPWSRVSRMLLSDWRMVIQIEILFIFVGAFEDLLEQGKLPRSPRGFFASFGASLVLFVMAVWAYVAGYSPEDIAIYSAASFGVILLLYIVSRVQEPTERRISIVALLTVVVVSGVYYHRDNDSPWNSLDPTRFQLFSFGRPTIDEFLARRSPERWQQRPQRHYFNGGDEGGDPIRKHTKSARYNLAWYAHDFAAFGYDNLRGSKPHTIMEQIVFGKNKTAARKYLGFMLQGSRVLAVNPDRRVTVKDLAHCDWALVCINDTGAEIKMIFFAAEGAQYSIKAAEETLLIENELYFAGWKGILSPVETGSSGSGELMLEAISVGPHLRAWSIPQGNWILTTRYETPGRTTSWILFGIGILLLVGVSRRKRDVLPPPSEAPKVAA